MTKPKAPAAAPEVEEVEAAEVEADLDERAAAGDEAAEALVYRIEENKATGELAGVPEDDAADAATVAARRDGTIRSGVTGI